MPRIAVAVVLGIALAGPQAGKAEHTTRSLSSCQDRAGQEFETGRRFARTVGYLVISAVEVDACPAAPSRYSDEFRPWYRVSFHDVRAPNSAVQLELGQSGQSHLLFGPGELVSVLRQEERGLRIARIEPNAAGVTEADLGTGPAAAQPLTSWAAPDRAAPAWPDLGETGTTNSSRWLRLEQGRVLDLSTGRTAIYDRLPASGLRERSVLGIAEDGRTLAWIAETATGQTRLVLSDLERGSSVAHSLDDAPAVLGVAVSGPPLDTPAPRWIVRLFRTVSGAGEPLRLAPRERPRRAHPALIKSDDGLWSTACIEAFALGPILIRDLRRHWNVELGRDGERPFEKRGDVFAVYDCRSGRSRSRPLHERTWFFTVEQFGFALSTNDAGGLQLGFMGREGRSEDGRADPTGQALGRMMAERINELLRSPQLARLVSRPGARPASPRSPRAPSRRPDG